MANEYTEIVKCVRYGPYNRDENQHTIYHPETETKMITDVENNISSAVRAYLEGKQATIPSDLKQLIQQLGPAAFGGDPGVSDSIRDYIENIKQEIISQLHVTTTITAKAKFYGSGTNHATPFSNTASKSINLLIGSEFNGIGDITVTSDSTALENAYVGSTVANASNAQTGLLVTGTALANPAVEITGYTNDILGLSALGLSAPIVASSSVKSASVYIAAVDSVNENFTDAVALTANFRKPMFAWVFVPSERSTEIFDTQYGTVITAQDTDNGYITGKVTGGTATQTFMTSSISSSAGIIFSLSSNTPAYFYIAVPYSPYYSHTTNTGTKFFDGTSSDGTALVQGYDISAGILDTDSNFSGGWKLIHDNYLITLSSGYEDRYRIYRTENLITGIGNYKIRDFVINS